MANNLSNEAYEKKCKLTEMVRDVNFKEHSIFDINTSLDYLVHGELSIRATTKKRLATDGPTMLFFCNLFKAIRDPKLSGERLNGLAGLARYTVGAYRHLLPWFTAKEIQSFDCKNEKFWALYDEIHTRYFVGEVKPDKVVRFAEAEEVVAQGESATLFLN